MGNYLYKITRLLFIVLTVFGINKSIEWVFLFNNYHGWTIFTYYSLELIIFIKGRPAKTFGKSIKDIFVPLLTVCSVYLFSQDGLQLINDWFSFSLFFAGYILLFVSLFTIGKSFDVTPSLKSIVTKGIYKFIRHPMYLAYCFLNLHFLLTVYSLNNLLVFFTFFFVLLIRIKIEEDFLLKSSEEYQDYFKKVRYKLLPFVY